MSHPAPYRLLALSLLALVTLLTATPAAGAPTASKADLAPRAHALPDAGWQRLDLPESGSRAWRYLPESLRDGWRRGDVLPVVVFFHGSGADPESWRPFLEGPAEEAGVVVLAPAPADPFGWGIAEDSATVAEALEELRSELPVDRRRIGLAGHSSGGAYALVLAYGTEGRFSGVFSFSAPFRNLLAVADPKHTPPARLWYGEQDPNHVTGHSIAWASALEHRDVEWELITIAGRGHNDIRPQDLEAGFTFLKSHPRPRGPNLLRPKRR